MVLLYQDGDGTYDLSSVYQGGLSDADILRHFGLPDGIR